MVSDNSGPVLQPVAVKDCDIYARDHDKHQQNEQVATASDRNDQVVKASDNTEQVSRHDSAHLFRIDQTRRNHQHQQLYRQVQKEAEPEEETSRRRESAAETEQRV